jgi:hypothetical protein
MHAYDARVRGFLKHGFIRGNAANFHRDTHNDPSALPGIIKLLIISQGNLP